MTLAHFPRRLASAPILVYQKLVSPQLAPNCRFRPTCSEFAIEAIDRLGVVQGGWLALRRLSRCHPWHEGGFDPVPEQWRRG